MIRSFSRKLLFWAGVLGGFFLFLPPVAAAVPEYSLVRMRQLNPDFSTYPESKGIVWMKRVSYGASRDGGVERTQLWVLLGRRGLEDRWLNWDIPEPPGGRTTILEATVYAFDSERKIADVLPAERRQGDVTMRSVRFESLPETFILVLCWKDSLPQGLNLEDLVWTQETLPVWESIVEVWLPNGRPFFYRTFREDPPEVKEKDGGLLHTWRSVNTEPLVSGQLLAVSRRGVAFSTRRGAESIARLMRDRAAAAVPPAPSVALAGFRKGMEAGTKTLLSWLYEQPDAVLPNSCSRTLPAEGPWTRGEKLFLAHAWLQGRGVNALLHWKMPFEPDADSPVCSELLQDPVLEILPFKGAKFREGFFCDMDDAPKVGRTSPLLMGSRIFKASEDGKLTSRKISGAKPAENRLRVLFDLSLASKGVLSGGTVRLQARGAWRPLLFRAWEKSREQSFVASLFQNLRGIGEITFRESKTEAELSFSLRETPGILGAQGRNLLVLLPAFIPEFFQSLASTPAPVELAFPFLLEQRIVLSLPPGVERVMLPADTERASDKVLYADSYKASKLKKATAESRLQVSAARLEKDDASSLKTALDLWRNFSTRPLPVKMRGGK